MNGQFKSSLTAFNPLAATSGVHIAHKAQDICIYVIN